MHQQKKEATPVIIKDEPVPANGKHKTYFPSGKVETITNYKDSKAEGEWKSYYENGQIR